MKPERPEIPLVKWEMKLNFYTTKPFNYPPRRLSYAEKSQVQNLLDDYIKTVLFEETSLSMHHL